MPYTGNPSTNTSDELRLLIWDTSTSTGGEILSDTEVTYFLTSGANILYSAANAAETVAAKLVNSTGGPTSIKVGDLSQVFADQTLGTASRLYKDRATQLRHQAALGLSPYSGGISISDKDTQLQDSDWNQPDMAIGMHDNPGDGVSSTGRPGEY